MQSSIGAELTLRALLERVGEKIAGFNIDGFIAKDLNGTEIPLTIKLSELSHDEIFFKTPGKFHIRLLR